MGTSPITSWPTAGRGRSRRLRLAVAPLALGAAAMLSTTFGWNAGAGETAPVTVGQAGGSVHCIDELLLLNPSVPGGPSYLVPAGDWEMTTWSVGNPRGLSGKVTVVVARATQQPGQYLVVGRGDAQAVPRTGITTFTLAEPMLVKGGDVVGIWSERNGPCGDRSSGAALDGLITPKPEAGQVVDTTRNATQARVNMAATLLPYTPPVNNPPDCTAVLPSVGELWPANNKMVDVSVSGAVDPDGDEVVTEVTGVVSDEPATGPGRRGFEADAVLHGDASVSLRAERAGGGDGRVYRVGFVASDPQGASCNGEVVVRVDHDKRKSGVASDDGQRHDVVNAPAAG